MAGGKETPRQKMIGMMYLVFIAMLALNMSKEVLSAFGFMNEKLTENNISTIEKNNQAYTNLATKALDQPEKFNNLNTQAIQIKTYSSDFYTYLEDLKTKMTADLDNKKDYESMDKTAFLDEYFFKGDKFTDEGRQFLVQINGYRTDVTNVLGENKQFNNILVKRFSTNAVTNRDGKKIKWLDYRFKGFPLVASLTNLTQMQADIRNTEADIISNLLGGQLESDVSMTNYNGIVKLQKNAFYPGDKVLGTVVLGREDPNLKPSRVVLNGESYDNFKDGAVNLDLKATSTGEKEIKGTIYFMENGVELPIPFESSYSVINKPNEAIVSADKMNVVYRGIANPVSVSLPGVEERNIIIKPSGHTNWKKVRAGSYLLTPGKNKTVTINVSATLEDDSKVNSKKIFRVKDIPAAEMIVFGPDGTTGGKSGKMTLPKSAFPSRVFKVGMQDFDFDLNIKTESFDISVGNQATITVRGEKLNKDALAAVSRSRRGDVISIFNIVASVSGTTYQLKKVYGGTIVIRN
ncbi:gliding motility protein GldM [Polaribacter sp.]|nr:gliding motility protein GldM [Polaribacter sp.]